MLSGVVNTDNRIGDNIKSARKSKGLTQGDLAEALGITAAAVSRYETGSRIPDIETCLQLAAVLDIPLESLASDDLIHFLGISELYDFAIDYWEYDGQPRPHRLNEKETLVVRSFRDLNPDGQNEAIKRIAEMTRLDEYKRKGSD